MFHPNLLIFLSFQTIVNAISLLIAAWQSWQVRNIKFEFSEAKFIGLAVFSMRQALLTGLPIVAMAFDLPTAFYIMMTTIVFTLCMVILLLIFWPKVIMQHKYSKATAEEQRRMLAVSIQRSTQKTRATCKDITSVYGSYSDEFAKVAKLEAHLSSSDQRNGSSEPTEWSGVTRRNKSVRFSAIRHSTIKRCVDDIQTGV
jgi:uncharacterized membrane protein